MPSENFLLTWSAHVVDLQVLEELVLGVQEVHRVEHALVDPVDFLDRLAQLLDAVRQRVGPGHATCA